MKTHAYVSAAALFCLSACTQVPLVPYDRSAASDNKTIGLLTVAWPARPSSLLASNDWAKALGLSAALVNGAMNNRETDLTKMLADQPHRCKFRLCFNADLESCRNSRYAVTPLQRVKRSDFLKSIPTASANQVDSYLDVVVMSYGYRGCGHRQRFAVPPLASGQGKTHQSFQRSAFAVRGFCFPDSLLTIKNVVTISPNPVYAFLVGLRQPPIPKERPRYGTVAAQPLPVGNHDCR